MNIQAHETTGSSPYELVFGQKPRAVIFPSVKNDNPLLEEDLEKDGVHIEEEETPAENDGQQQQQESEGDEQGGAEGKKRKRQQSEDGWEEQRDASGKRRCLQVGEQSQEITSGSESDEEKEQTKSLLTMEKHSKVRQGVRCVIFVMWPY